MSMTTAKIIRNNAASEYYFKEGCFINEWSNSDADAEVSIARARVEPGQTTKWHRLQSITERYVILQGAGVVEVEGLDAQAVTPGDVVIIPENAWQRITNTSASDLIFLAICSPRFNPAHYFSRDE